jgi:hypothetical protein
MFPVSRPQVAVIGRVAPPMSHVPGSTRRPSAVDWGKKSRCCSNRQASLESSHYLDVVMADG